MSKGDIKSTTQSVAVADGVNPFSLEGEIALITGGGTGLGLAIARYMASAGARVILAGRRAAVLKEAAEGQG